MRRLITFLLAVTATATATATSIKGGYLGKRLIICAEGSYNPNYATWKDFLFSYNLQYGGNIHFVTGRFSEVGVSYNMYSMGAHNRYREDLANSGKIKGYQVGFTFRKYREKRGGLAPIGKFIDYNLYYHSDTYTPALIGVAPYMGDPIELTGISASIGFGTQGIFWNRVVANAGLRLGGPVYTLSSTSGDSLNGDLPEYMKERLMYKDFFSVFFGVGIIL
jgi:hypothetical protein